MNATSLHRPVVIMMTAFPLQDHVSELRDKIQAVIQKPFDVIELAELVQDCVDARRANDQRQSLFRTAGDASPVAETLSGLTAGPARPNP